MRTFAKHSDCDSHHIASFDGIRGVAVLAVLIGHAGYFNNGWVGVDPSLGRPISRLLALGINDAGITSRDGPQITINVLSPQNELHQAALARRRNAV
jgi:hypothetical protein